MDALEQLLATFRQGRAHEALDEGLLVGEGIGEPVTRRGGRLLQGSELVREHALRAEGDLHLLEHLRDVEDRRHAGREGDHLEGLEALEQRTPGGLTGAQDPDVEHLDLWGAGLERKGRCLRIEVEQIPHEPLPVPTSLEGG